MKAGKSSILRLPQELRDLVWQFAFDADAPIEGQALTHRGCLILNRYSIMNNIRLVCRDFYKDITLLSHAGLAAPTFLHMMARLENLSSREIKALRSVFILADVGDLKHLIDHHHLFGRSDLRLDTLTIVLRPTVVTSSYSQLKLLSRPLAEFLRRLENLKRLMFVQDNAGVKGSLHGWYNHLRLKILEVDYRERYRRSTPSLEHKWWRWRYCQANQVFVLEAQEAKPFVDQREYRRWLLSLYQRMKASEGIEPRDPNMYCG